MAYNYEYPYTDPNRYNADWLLNTVKRGEERFAELKAFVVNYFKTLDIGDELEAIINNLIADGTLTRAFLEDYITYATPQVYGARGDGVTDDTEAIRKCIEENTIIHFPKGDYLVSSDFPINNKFVFGVGKSSRLFRTDGKGIIFTMRGISTIRDLSIVFEATKRPTVDFAIDAQSCNDSNRIDNVFIQNCYGAIRLRDLSGTYLDNLTVENCYYNGVEFDNATDIYMKNILMSNVGIGNSIGTGLAFTNYVQAIEAVNLNIIAFNNNIVFNHNSADYSVSNAASYCVFTNSYFDGSRNPLNIQKCNSFKFVNCWISNRTSGCVIGAYAYNTTFINTQFRNNDDNGCIVLADSRFTTFIGCDFINNRNNGILLEQGSMDIIINGCTAANLEQYKDFDFAQNTGINITDSVINTIISNCFVRFNTNAQIDNKATDQSVIINANIAS